MEILTKTKKINNRTWLFVKPIGELDMDTADQLKDAIVSQQDKNGTRMLVLDFEKVNFIDSSGLGVLLGRYRQLTPLGGKIVITHVNPHVYRLLFASGLHRIIDIDKPTMVKYAKEGI